MLSFFLKSTNFLKTSKNIISSTQVVAAKRLPQILLLKLLLKDVINLLIPVSYFVTIQAYYSSLFMYNLSPNH